MRQEGLDWDCFDRAGYETTDGTVSTEEHAERAVLLLDAYRARWDLGHGKEALFRPDSLTLRLKELEPQLTVEGRDGIYELRRSAIERVASELTPQVLEMPSEAKTKRKKSRGQSMYLKELLISLQSRSSSQTEVADLARREARRLQGDYPIIFEKSPVPIYDLVAIKTRMGKDSESAFFRFAEFGDYRALFERCCVDFDFAVGAPNAGGRLRSVFQNTQPPLDSFRN